MTIKSTLHIVLLSLILWSCIEPYYPDPNAFEKTIVVDGYISDGPGPHTIKLSYTSSLDKQWPAPLSGAQISILQNDVEIDVLEEGEPGTYYTQNYVGKIGEFYKIRIETPDNLIIESNPEEITPANGVDSIYYTIETQATDDPELTYNGFQFHVDFKNKEKTNSYYLYNIEDTYEYQSDFTVDLIFHGTAKQPLDTFGYVCWKTEHIQEYFVHKSIATGSIQHQTLPLQYVPTTSRKMARRYSILLKQLAISEEAFDFFFSINEQNNNETMNSNQPYRIKGNLNCVSNPDVTVLGYFIVAGETEKRVFFDKPYYIKFDYDVCVPNVEAASMATTMGTETAPLYFTFTADGLGLAAPECFDCKLKGGTVEKPDFWID